MLKLDIGCGDFKRPGFIGVDLLGDPDVRCDVANQRLPFDDASADHVYSSHCMEHIIPHGQLFHVFKEITRVCEDQGLIEIWHPYAFHSDAFIFGHFNYISEAFYDHFACLHRATWKEQLGAQWVLEEVRYGMDRFVLDDMKSAAVGIEFAIRYLHDVVREIGVFIRVDRTNAVRPEAYRRVITPWGGRQEIIMQLSDGPCRAGLQTTGDPPTPIRRATRRPNTGMRAVVNAIKSIASL